MAAPLTAEQRLIYGSLAFDKKAEEGWSNAKIAEHVGVHRNTVPGLIEHEALIRGRNRSPAAKAVALVRYERVIQTAREELSRPQPNGLAKPALLNAIINAQTRIDRIEGNEAPKALDVTRRTAPDLSGLTDEQLGAVLAAEEKIEGEIRAILEGGIAAPSENGESWSGN